MVYIVAIVIIIIAVILVLNRGKIYGCSGE